MDPFSQGLAGALCSQGKAPVLEMRLAFIAGFLAGMAPDLDILIQSGADPLLNLEYHRHFTHALLFAPLGGLLVALLLWPLLRKRLLFARLYAYCTLGMLSHGLLDTCTSYGTYLLWPFSQQRYAWDIISIIDPLFTLPLLLLLALGLWRRSRSWWLAAAIWAFAYLGLGVIQQHRAWQAQTDLLAQRGQQSQQRRVMPSLGSLLLWRSVTRVGDEFQIDAIRLPLNGDRQIIAGGSVAVWRQRPQTQGDSVVARDIRRFAHFADHYLAEYQTSEAGSEIIADARYAAFPNDTRPLWGLQFDPAAPQQHARPASLLDLGDNRFSDLIRMTIDTRCEPPACFSLAP